MTRTIWCPVLVAAVLTSASVAGCGSQASLATVGFVDGGGSFAPGLGGDAGPGAFDAHIEENHVTVTFVTVSCSEGCAEVQAVGTGGYPPYAYAWGDGPTTALRRICPDASTKYRVTVTDTGTTGEFPRAPESVQLPLDARVLACPEGGMGDAGGEGAGDGGACTADADAFAPETVTPDYLDNAVSYFGGGADLPAGRYSLTYVSGCIKYNGYSNFTVNGASNYEYWLVGATTSDEIAVAPGTDAVGLPFGYTNYSDCVTANLALAPLDFDFDGGKLGVYSDDFQPSDNVEGPDGGAPTWRLSGACP
jgi:hypothetical protein